MKNKKQFDRLVDSISNLYYLKRCLNNVSKNKTS